MTKICSSCLVEKDIADFRKRSASKDGLSGSCKDCKRAYDNKYYLENQSRKDDIRRSNINRRMALRTNVLVYLLKHPCVDCGEPDPIVLDFDHQDDKVSNVSTMIRDVLAWDTIEREIAKCEVRCANCHRRKTATDFGWWQLKQNQPV